MVDEEDEQICIITNEHSVCCGVSASMVTVTPVLPPARLRRVMSLEDVPNTTTAFPDYQVKSNLYMKHV